MQTLDSDDTLCSAVSAGEWAGTQRWVKQLPSDPLKVCAGGSVDRGAQRPSAAPGEAVTGATSRGRARSVSAVSPGSRPEGQVLRLPHFMAGTKDAKGPAPRCPAKGMCQVQVQDPGWGADPVPRG